MRNTKALLAALVTTWVCGGCTPKVQPAGIGCYLPRPRDLARIKRVVLVELSYDDRYPHLRGDMTQALAKAIQGRMFFHVEVVRSDDPEVRELSLRAQGRKTLKDLGELREAFKCDAVLVGLIRHYEPYPRMQMALYLQLLDLKAGRLVWAVEHAWDTGDHATQQRMEEFFDRQMGEDYGPLDWRIAMVSPKVFQKYVAREVAETLRVGPLPPRPVRTSSIELLAENFRRIVDN